MHAPMPLAMRTPSPQLKFPFIQPFRNPKIYIHKKPVYTHSPTHSHTYILTFLQKQRQPSVSERTKGPAQNSAIPSHLIPFFPSHSIYVPNLGLGHEILWSFAPLRCLGSSGGS